MHSIDSSAKCVVCVFVNKLPLIVAQLNRVIFNSLKSIERCIYSENFITMNRLDKTESLPENEWEILKDVYNMLIDGKVLNTPNDEPIVRFKHPEELRVSRDNTNRCFNSKRY